MNRIRDVLRGQTRHSYADRRDAGRAVASALTDHHTVEADDDVLVIGLARGGLPVAAEVASALGADLDVAVVRKLGVPGHEELALGAITSSRMVINEDLMRSLRVPDDALDAVIDREQAELARREDAYRGGRPPAAVAGRVVLLVDDGIATGATMRVAALDARAGGASRVVVAVPTAPGVAASEFAVVADQFVCPHTPDPYVAVGLSYDDFHQVEDAEVMALLGRRLQD